MHNRAKVVASLTINVVSVLLAFGTVWWMRDPSSTYFSFGPHPGLQVLTVTIDTWGRWGMVVFFLALMGVADVLTEELGMPVLTFTIYNPDKTFIHEFHKNELQVLANLTYLTSAVKKVLLTIVQVTQFDLAMMHIVVTELVTVLTIRLLLNDKRFHKDMSP